MDPLYANHQHLQRFYEQQDNATRMHVREPSSPHLPQHHDLAGSDPPPHPDDHLQGLSDEPPNMADEGYREGSRHAADSASDALGGQLPQMGTSETLSTSPGSGSGRLGTPRALLRRFLSRTSETGLPSTELTALASEDAETPLLGH